MSGLTFRVGDVAKVRDAAKARGYAVSGDSFQLGGVTFRLRGVSVHTFDSSCPRLSRDPRRSQHSK